MHPLVNTEQLVVKLNLSGIFQFEQAVDALDASYAKPIVYDDGADDGDGLGVTLTDGVLLIDTDGVSLGVTLTDGVSLTVIDGVVLAVILGVGVGVGGHDV